MIRYYYICILTCIALFQTTAQDLSISFAKNERECVFADANVTIITNTYPPIHYLWSNGAITANVDGLEPGHYSVKVTDDQNKDTTIYFNIEPLVCEPSAENNFTPNSDGFNDSWSISKLGAFPDFDLYVYNRWGQQVHHQSASYISWDGRSLGIPLPDATYYYILYFSKSDKNKFIKGSVSIIR